MRNIIESIRGALCSGKEGAWRLALSGIAAGLLSACASSGGVKDTTRTFQTVVIDAGHGGHDTGARSRWSGAEKTVALDVARRLESKLRVAGFRTVMTRQGDTFVPLDTRAAISNRQDNALFVSIHFNHARKRRVQGAEVYYRSRVSQPVARRILQSLDGLPGTSARGVIPANFRVLRLNQFPAVLVECGYISSPTEGRRCASPRYREGLAEAIASAIVEQRSGGPARGPSVAAR